jgi:sugar/nucleoside kinase (ribokinase family)
LRTSSSGIHCSADNSSVAREKSSRSPASAAASVRKNRASKRRGRPGGVMARKTNRRGAAWGRRRAEQPTGPVVDSYGAGDSFAAALTVALGADQPLDAALELAARCGAAALTRRGPYGEPPDHDRSR